jgi:hypothetical protein
MCVRFAFGVFTQARALLTNRSQLSIAASSLPSLIDGAFHRSESSSASSFSNAASKSVRAAARKSLCSSAGVSFLREPEVSPPRSPGSLNWSSQDF